MREREEGIELVFSADWSKASLLLFSFVQSERSLARVHTPRVWRYSLPSNAWITAQVCQSSAVLSLTCLDGSEHLE